MVHCNTFIYVSCFVKLLYLHEFMAASNVDCQMRFIDNFLVDYSKAFQGQLELIQAGFCLSALFLVFFVYLFIMS